MTLRPLVDSHCHIDGPEYDADRDEVIAGLFAFVGAKIVKKMKQILSGTSKVVVSSGRGVSCARQKGNSIGLPL